MAIEEKEFSEQDLNKLIKDVEKDDLPTNIFTNEDTDPLVLLGKLNEIIAKLKGLQTLIASSDKNSTQALNKAIEALTNSTTALENSITAKETANSALDKAEVADSTAIEAINDATHALSVANDALETAKNALDIASGGEQILERVEQCENDITEIKADIINLTEMLSATEELADQALPKSSFINVTTNSKVRFINCETTENSYTYSGGVEFYNDEETYNDGEKVTTHQPHTKISFLNNHFITQYASVKDITEIDNETGKYFNYDANYLYVKFTYPKDAVIFTMDKNFDPIEEYGGEWEELESGYVLQTISTNSEEVAGNKIPAGLPNIEGQFWCNVFSGGSGLNTGGSGALSAWTNWSQSGAGGGSTQKLNGLGVGFNAKNGASTTGIYGNSSTVQPKAIKIYVWHKVN